MLLYSYLFVTKPYRWLWGSSPVYHKINQDIQLTTTGFDKFHQRLPFLYWYCHISESHLPGKLCHVRSRGIVSGVSIYIHFEFSKWSASPFQSRRLSLYVHTGVPLIQLWLSLLVWIVILVVPIWNLGNIVLVLFLLLDGLGDLT